MPSKLSSSSGVVFLDRARATAEVRRAVARLAERVQGVREVWLFGSLARGNATPRSDADLMIVVDEDTRRPMDRIPRFLSLLDDLGRPVDLTVVTAGEWKRGENSPFRREVLAHGIRLHPP